MSAWRSRTSRPSARASVREGRSPGLDPPLLSRIAGVRREHASLQIQIVACRAALEDRPSVLVQDNAGGASAGTDPDRCAVRGDEGPPWTMTLLLN
ncbi:MAG: hypothetical protein M3376_11510 [Actinomycetota bacterium]|nr:hypothetical protein [Actinomycetota bacterium]